MDQIRIGVIGVGVMGSSHARNIPTLRNLKLAAVCDIEKQKADRIAGELNCKAYYDSGDLIGSGDVDAVIIATPHYSHTTIGIAALERNLHVLVEKPISVHKADCERLIAVSKTHRDRVFAAMFMTRTDPSFKKLKQLVTSGELGRITRVNWICTRWFRTQAYYESGGWRATWKGEGGGVLLNQGPHQLDLFQWICGMPCRVTGFCRIAQWHDIEVEDDVTAYMQYHDGATGVFIITTGEAPGTDRFEISGDRGKVVFENGKIHFTRNELPASEFSRTSREMFGQPPVWEIDVPVQGQGGMHNEIIQNFADSILAGIPLIAPAHEGIHSVELANAMLYSSMTGTTVDLPLDSKEYEEMLMKLIKESKFRKNTRTDAKADLAASFLKT